MSSFTRNPSEHEAGLRRLTSRIPTRSGKSEDGDQSKPIKHVSKLAKRAARSNTAAQSSKSRTGGAPVSGPSADHGAIANTTTRPSNVRTPSLVSGSSASTFDSPESALRQKPSGAIDRYAASGSLDPFAESIARSNPIFDQSRSRVEYHDSVFGIAVPQGQSRTHVEPYHVVNEYKDRYPPHNVTSPIPGYASSATPSTRHTGSPWSYATTPSSASSYSPALTSTSGLAWSPPLNNQRRDGQKDPSSSTQAASQLESGGSRIRESSTSSSNKTVRPLEKERSTFAARTQVAKHMQTKSQVSLTKPDSIKSAGRRKLTKEPPVPIPKKPVRVPPELAHLNVEPDPIPPLRKPDPPLRPSRSGVGNISDMRDPSPIIQSDLPRLNTSYHMRNSSSDNPASTVSTTTQHRFGSSPGSSSRTVSPRIDSAISSPPTEHQFDRHYQPASTETRTQRKDSPAVVSTHSPAKSPRFGFFSRKPKPAASTTEKPRRQSRPGPVAGTGHEGYARFGLRGRSSSTASGTGFRSPSADSTASAASSNRWSRHTKKDNKSLDELNGFLKQHKDPIYLRGSGSSFGNMSSVSNISLASLPSAGSSSTDGYAVRPLLPSAMDSSESFIAQRRTHTRHTTAESSGDDCNSSAERSCAGELSARPRIDATSKDNPPSTSHSAQYENEGLWLRSQQPKRKWSFFQRSMVSPRSIGKAKADVHDMDEPVSNLVHSNRPVAHYTMVDQEQPFDLLEVERLLQDNEASQDEGDPIIRRHSKVVPYEPRHQSLLPSPPEAEAHVFTKPGDHAASIVNIHHTSGAPPDGFESADEFENYHGQQLEIPGHSIDSLRQPRLSPIGRIPRVVSKRDRERKLSDNSFSRPFVRNQPRPGVKPSGALYSQFREMASPIESAIQLVSSASTRSESERKSSTFTNASSQSTSRTSTDRYQDFLEFPARKGSEQSYLSNSSGYSSRPSGLQSADSRMPQQEDVWNEYNDFMDAHSIPVSQLAPSQLPVPSSLGRPPTMALPALPGASPRSLPPSVPQQVSRFLKPSLSPIASDTDTIYGWINGYGNRSTSTLVTDRNSGTNRQSMRCSVVDPRDSFASSWHSVGSRHSRSTSLPDVDTGNIQLNLAASLRIDRNSELSQIAEISPQTARHSTSMREAALKTSKWLSFGRVLFSAAHRQVQLAESSRILVLDGLSSDWSYYVALCYPRAQVYNMCTGAVDPWPSIDGDYPGNHRQIPIHDISASFPFPKGFFDAVVFRFPTVTTEHAYASSIAECRRVLRPSGFLEVVVLDLDLMKMGNKARRAVRGLKTRMQAKDQHVCLSNLSDILVRQIGRSAFEGVQRCIVGVPTAGKIALSQDASSSSSDTSQQTCRNGDQRPSRTFSFNNLLEEGRQDQLDDGQKSDEDITKMVAKVGCWWYTNCYEKAVLPADQSIWTDRSLRRECQREGTSFRLLICSAQKPAQTRRRTVSV